MTYANSFVYGNILIDAGVLPMAVEPYATDIDTIVITHAHYDHIAHLPEIAAMCGDATVCIHHADAPGGISLDDREARLLFSGDTVCTGGSFGRDDCPGGDRRALAASIERLSGLEVDSLYPGHGEPAQRDGWRHIAAAREALRLYG